MSATVKGCFYVFLASVFFSLTGTLRTFAPDESTTYVITEMRMIIGFICLLIWCLATGKMPRSYRNLPFTWLLVCIVGSIGYQLLFFGSVKVVGVAVGTVVAMGVTPFWTAIIAWAIFKKKPSKAWYISTVIAVIGVVMLNLTELDIEEPIYLLLPVLAGFCEAFYIVGCAQFVGKLEPETTILIIVGSMAIILAPFLWIDPVAWVFTPSGAVVCLGLGVITCGIAFPLFMAGVRYAPPVTCSTVNMVEPVCAACLGIFLLGEPATLMSISGIALICFSVLYLVYMER